MFSLLINLENLFVGNNDQERINQGLYNRFHGSLKFLQNYAKLVRLDISNTDFRNGVEYLPNSIWDFVYDTDLRPDCLLKEIEKEISWFKQRKNSNWSPLVEETNLFNFIKSQFTTDSFQAELNKHKSFISANDNNSLLERWKKANLHQLTINSLKEQLEKLKSQLLNGNQLNEQLSEQISFLEKQISEAEFLISQQKYEITQAYLNLTFNKEDEKDLKELINLHKVYTKAKREETENLTISRDEYASFYFKLEKKLGKDFINAIELILAKFETLYYKEWELDTQTKQRDNFINIKDNLESQLKMITESFNELKQKIIIQEKSKCKDPTQIINNYTEIKKQITYHGDIIQSIVDVTNTEITNFLPNIENLTIQNKSNKQEKEIFHLIEQQKEP